MRPDGKRKQKKEKKKNKRMQKGFRMCARTLFSLVHSHVSVCIGCATFNRSVKGPVYPCKSLGIESNFVILRTAGI